METACLSATRLRNGIARLRNRAIPLRNRVALMLSGCAAEYVYSAEVVRLFVVHCKATKAGEGRNKIPYKSRKTNSLVDCAYYIEVHEQPHYYEYTLIISKIIPLCGWDLI